MSDPVGDWNHRQVFDARGLMFRVGHLMGGTGYVVARLERFKGIMGTVVSHEFPVPTEAVAEAERLRKAAPT